MHIISLLRWSIAGMVLWGWVTPLTAQQEATITISGTVKDAENGETLIAATVGIPALSAGTNTNEYGFYSISIVPTDSVTLEFSYVGFQNKSYTLPARSDQQLNVELSTGLQLEEVVVKANSYEEQLSSTQMSVEAITTREAKLLPAFLEKSIYSKPFNSNPVFRVVRKEARVCSYVEVVRTKI